MEIVNHYVLERVIGEGGFGRVYQAVDSRLNCKVALKQYNNPDILEKEVSFYNELAGIAGILSVRDRFVENGQAFLVMDFVDGMTLEQFISQKNGRLSGQEAAEIIRQVLIVLNQIHSRGYIHCDLGTDNILLDRQGNVKIIDFTSMKSDMQKNNPEEVQLKNGFSAYEQYITDGTMGMYTDIYAVGAVLYRMLTGAMPPSAMQIAQNPDLIRQSNLRQVMSERIEFIVKMCLETEPQKRFQTVAALYNALFNENINEALYEPARIGMQPQTQNPQVQNPQSPSGQALQQPENRKDIKTFTSAPVQPQRNDMVTVNPGSSMNVEGNTKKKKSKKKAVVLSICAIFLVVAVIVTGLIVSNIRKENESDDTSQEAMDKKQDDYEQAMQLCNQSNYDDAVKIFEELGDYSDSLSNLNKIADKYMEHSMTDKARDIYEYLSDYDSQDVEDDLKELFKLLNIYYKKTIKMITFDYYGRKTSIFLKDIHYITSFGHDISIVCDQETYTYRSSLKDALKLIDSPVVVQVHRSYAVSMMYIKEVDKNNIILKDETCITLGKKYVDEFMFQYREYLIS